MKRLKKGDSVIVIAGKNKGKSSTIMEVNEDFVRLAGVNMLKKHMKPNPQKNIPGGIVEKEGKIHISNVAHLNPNTNKADKIGYKFMKKGDATKKVRYFKSDNELVDAV